MTDETDKRALAVKVAQLYYQNDWRQSRIAAELNLSRPTVSRLLQYARESGIVQIRINNPLVSTQQLADQLKAHYHLSNAIVVPSEMTASGELLELVGAAAAQYIEKVVKNDDTIGLAWGKTIHAIAQHLSPEDVHGVTVVQLKGSVANTKQKNYAFESVNAFASAFHTLPQYLPLPVIFDHQTTKDDSKDIYKQGKVIVKFSCQTDQRDVGQSGNRMSDEPDWEKQGHNQLSGIWVHQKH